MRRGTGDGGRETGGWETGDGGRGEERRGTGDGGRGEEGGRRGGFIVMRLIGCDYPVDRERLTVGA